MALRRRATRGKPGEGKAAAIAIALASQRCIDLDVVEPAFDAAYMIFDQSLPFALISDYIDDPLHVVANDSLRVERSLRATGLWKDIFRVILGCS